MTEDTAKLIKMIKALPPNTKNILEAYVSGMHAASQPPPTDKPA
jgi:hypothetical protein